MANSWAPRDHVRWSGLSRHVSSSSSYASQSAGGSVQLQLGTALTSPNFGDHSKVKALAQVGVRGNQLFLTAIRENLDRANRGPLFEKALAFFENELLVIFPQSLPSNLAGYVARNPDFASFAGDFLNAASTGVERLRVQALEVKDGTLGMPPELLEWWRKKPLPGRNGDYCSN